MKATIAMRVPLAPTRKAHSSVPVTLATPVMVSHVPISTSASSARIIVILTPLASIVSAVSAVSATPVTRVTVRVYRY